MRKLGTIGIILCILISYFIFVSYYSIDITYYTIESQKINDEINIAMIADVHDCKNKDKIVSNLNALKPDLILCVGDIIDSNSEDDKSTISFLSQLTHISDVYMSIGNQEETYYKTHREDFKNLEDIGVKVLEEEYIDLVIHNNEIRLGGMYSYAFGQKEGKITHKDMNEITYHFLEEMTKTSSFQLMMAHRPDSFIFCDAKDWNIDLVVSGHTHGGQVILPFIGGLYAPEQGWLPIYDYGQFQLNQMNIIITRGVSHHGYLPRLNNPSEIVCITLK